MYRLSFFVLIMFLLLGCSSRHEEENRVRKITVTQQEINKEYPYPVIPNTYSLTGFDKGEIENVKQASKKLSLNNVKHISDLNMFILQYTKQKSISDIRSILSSYTTKDFFLAPVLQQDDRYGIVTRRIGLLVPKAILKMTLEQLLEIMRNCKVDKIIDIYDSGKQLMVEVEVGYETDPFEVAARLRKTISVNHLEVQVMKTKP